MHSPEKGDQQLVIDVAKGPLIKLALLRRCAELIPGPRGAAMLAGASHETGDIKRCYQIALRALHALGPGSSSFGAFTLSLHVISSIRAGALGPSWSWSQVAPFVANVRTAGMHLKRWMVPALWDDQVKEELEEFAMLERDYGDCPL